MRRGCVREKKIKAGKKEEEECKPHSKNSGSNNSSLSSTSNSSECASFFPTHLSMRNGPISNVWL
jgi:hypothetical protein